MTDKPQQLLEKSEVALRGARLLFEAEDYEGAADRAYYGLFHAARALLAHVADDETRDIKTHSGLISAFGLTAIRELGLSVSHGRLLNFAEDLRRKADYDLALFANKAAVEDILTKSVGYLEDIRVIILGDN